MPRRHGSLQFRPRKRARTLKAVFRSYPKLDLDKPTLVAFPGYKVGMLHVVLVDDRPGRLTTGQEITLASTVVETPPVKIVGFRAYRSTPKGLAPMSTGIRVEKDSPLSRLFPVGDGVDNLDKALSIAKESLDKIAELRALVHTHPYMAGGVSKKTPELTEIPLIGGTQEERLNFIEEKMGALVRVSDVFKEGQFIDITGVTKGKGFEGVVRRFGVELLPHKAGKGRWKVGSLGSRHPPYITWRVPRPGQTGFHKRTEYNKRILKIGLADIGEDGSPKKLLSDINPKGGFTNYGLVRCDYVLVSGSVMGPPKRFVMMRYAIRPPKYELGAPKISYISTVGRVG